MNWRKADCLLPTQLLPFDLNKWKIKAASQLPAGVPLAPFDALQSQNVHAEPSTSQATFRHMVLFPTPHSNDWRC